MITEEQYQQAVQARDQAQETISQYFQQQQRAFEIRMTENPIFTDEELIYSRFTLCPCGHGLAYPKGCGPWHYWDCSAILKGISERTVLHTAQLPFAIFDVKSESAESTTRGVYRPRSTESSKN